MRTLLMVVFFFSSFSAAAKRDCFKHTSSVLKKDIAYCIYQPQPDKVDATSPVVYFMHALGGNVNTFKDYTYQSNVDTLTQEGSLAPATYVSFSTTPDSFFSDDEGGARAGFEWERWFMSEFLFYVERTHGLCQKAQCRSLLGISMGGFGVLKTALKHPEFFRCAVANSPALGPFEVYAEQADWDAYFLRHPVGPVNGRALLERVKKVFPNPEIANVNDPNVILKQASDARVQEFPWIYVDMGTKDEFGFHEGSEIFGREMKKRGLRYQYDLVQDGSHVLFLNRFKETFGFINKNCF